MNEKYGFDTRSKIQFLKDRSFRIFPAYWLSILLSIVLIIFIPVDFVENYHVALKMPEDILTWTKNIFIFGLRPGFSTRLTPPAWALNIELIYYIVICLYTARSFKRTFAATVIFLLFCCYAIIKVESPYAQILCSGLPFMLGGCLYFGVKKISCRNNKYVAANLVVLMLLLMSFMLIYFFRSIPFPLCLLAFQIPFAFLVAVLFFTTSAKFKTCDKILGDMSYYIYLLHWQIGLALTWFLGLMKGSDLVWTAIPFVLLISLILVLTFDPVVLKLKKIVTHKVG